MEVTNMKTTDNIILDITLQQTMADLDEGNYVAAFRGFESITDESLEAKYQMAMMMYNGYVEGYDASDAIQLYNECAESGLNKAFGGIACCYFYGHGVEKNDIKAYEQVQKAFMCEEPGCYEAYAFAGEILIETIDESLKDINKGIEYLNKALNVNADDEVKADAYFSLGKAYSELGLHEKAFEAYNNCAEYDSVFRCVAYARIGICYMDGEGVEQNAKKAFEYLYKSAELGFAPAKKKIGEMYYNGYGTDRDYDKAEEITAELLSATPDDSDLLYKMGDILFKKKEFDDAYEYYKKSCDNGKILAKKGMGSCCVCWKQFNRAVELLSSALEAADNDEIKGEIYYWLGMTYNDESNSFQDKEKAIDYFIAAAENADDDILKLCNANLL